MKRTRCTSRRAVAAVWALVVLAVVSSLGMYLVARVSMARKEQDRELARDQAEWLVRSGLELAIDRLLAKKGDYQGETVSPIAGAEVKVRVTAQAKTDVYAIECEVQYKVGPRGIAVTQSGRRTVKVDGKGKVETLAEP